MDPVYVLSVAVTAAKYIRSSADPDGVLDRAFRQIGVENPEPRPTAVRIASLIEAAGEHNRRDVLDYIRSQSGPVPLNRPPADAAGEELPDPDPEAERLALYVSEHEREGRSMFGDRAFGAFDIATRSGTNYFGGRTVIVRDGVRLTAEEAGEARVGDAYTSENEGLPPAVRCLLDYPLEVPILFTIETGSEPWSVWDICCAVADQYARVYEQTGRHGVWGHDMDDLVIEEILYFPEEKLIYPLIGS